MAKDVPAKTASNSNTERTSPPFNDQQKVPPLRIVLNASGNQKSSSTAIAVSASQQDFKRDKAQDAKADGVKAGGRVRIKLGTNKQVGRFGSGVETTSKNNNDDGSKSKTAIGDRQDNSTKEEGITNYNHLRRITRRTQKTLQTVHNEDEESISSMTSTDENQNTTNPNSDISQETGTVVATAAATNTTTITATTTPTNSGSSNSDTPRRYKRRKLETSEFQLSDYDCLLGIQNYKLPTQNSFELYRNIRKQVDKKLRSLTSIHPRTPYGFRDYMLSKRAYLLDGNRLGDGTNLFMNEDGGLNPAPLGKYHALRHTRIDYTVPNRARVPLGLPVNSPLYNLFIDQEKERYKMRMQHIKEREKLTLSVEQEIMRVHNQAAMVAANQLEPFSACTMLKHQEIYNYLDSDGHTIQSSEDAQLDKAQQDRDKTRRHDHGQVSPTPNRRNSDTEVITKPEIARKEVTQAQELDNSTIPETRDGEQDQSKMPSVVAAESGVPSEEKTVDTSQVQAAMNDQAAISDSQPSEVDTAEKIKSEDKESSGLVKSEKSNDIEETKKSGDVVEATENSEPVPETGSEVIPQELPTEASTIIDKSELNNLSEEKSDKMESEPSLDGAAVTEGSLSAKQEVSEKTSASEKVDFDKALKQTNQPTESLNGSIDARKTSVNEQVVPAEHSVQDSTQDLEQALSDDERQALNRETFLSQLQEIDDKWERIRNEMLIRHRNEAESLHAIQKLEWEWKTKEIGACDVRTTPVIDNTLVPKLNIYSQDY